MGLNLPETTGYIKARLDEMGIEYHTLVDGNAIVGIIKGGQAGKTIALRADMDALPIKEETGLPFAAVNGCMHACGRLGGGSAVLSTGCMAALSEGEVILNIVINKNRGNVG